MSGITGFWNRDGRPADERVIAAMSATLRHRGLDGEGRWIGESAAFACQRAHGSPESVQDRQPVTGPSGSIILFDGRLDNRAALEGRLGLRGAHGVPDAGLALAAYESWGVPFVDAMLGDFALAVFDPRESRLLLARDPIGVRPLYSHTGTASAVFGSEIKALLRHPAIRAEPDAAGLADVLTRGGPGLAQRDRTCFAGVTALQPGHIAVIECGRVTMRRYWDFDVHRCLEPRSYEAWVEEFAGRFETAVRRRVRTATPVAVSVSGGLDSSSIFCQALVLHRARRTPCPAVLGIAYSTVDGMDGDERRFLDEIERRYQVGVQRIAVEPHVGVRQGAEAQAWHGETPVPDYLWLVTRAVQEAARAGGARTLLSGQWGDQVLFSTGYLVDLARRFAWPAVVRHLREYRRWFPDAEAAALRARFVADLARHHAPDAVVAVLRWLRRRRATPSPRDSVFTPAFHAAAASANGRGMPAPAFAHVHARSLYLEIRSKYALMSMDWNNKVAAMDGLDAVFPMLDRELLEFLVATPGDVQNRGGVPRRLLRDAMRGVLPEAVAARRWRADISEPVNRGIASDFGRIEAELNGGAVVRRGFVDAAALSRLLARARRRMGDNDYRDAWNLTDLFSFEVWLRMFFDAPAAKDVA